MECRHSFSSFLATTCKFPCYVTPFLPGWTETSKNTHLNEGGTVSHIPSLSGVRFFSHASWLLLDLTGLNCGGDWTLEILEKIQDRQMERNLGSAVLLYAWLEMHNPHYFSSLSLFFKALFLAVL
jgi:hypothetical protein